MSPAPSPTIHRPLAGILFMCGAGTVFPVMNGIVQTLSPRYNSELIVWARTAAHLLFILALFAPRWGSSLMRTARPGWQIGRSVVLLASTLCYFNGIRYLHLPEATSISFTAPLIVTLLAWPFLGEPIGMRRLMAVLFGFAGVLIVIRPGTAFFQWASLFIVGSACCYAFYQLMTRRVAGFDPPETSAAYSALVGTLIMSLLLPAFWIAPSSLGDAALMILLGVLGGLGHYFVARAMALAPASIVAPFMYWQMIGALAVGYVVSGRLPDLNTWIGAAFVIAAGLYIGWHETRPVEQR